MQKRISTLAGIIIIVVVAVILFGGVFAYQYIAPREKLENTEGQMLIGGDKDGHGCLIAAGYSWCELKQKCLRTWEEQCETDATAGWETYTNSQYGFQINYPSNWKLTDTSSDVQTSDKGPVKDIGVNIESPLKYDLVGYKGVPVSYRILLYRPEETIISVADFGSPDAKYGHQSWWNISVDKNVKEATNEYEIGQQIISTFKFTK